LPPFRSEGRPEAMTSSLPATSRFRAAFSRLAEVGLALDGRPEPERDEHGSRDGL